MRKTLAMIFAFVFSSSFVFGDTPPSGGEEPNGNPIIIDLNPDKTRILRVEFSGYSTQSRAVQGRIFARWYNAAIVLDTPLNIQFVVVTNADTGFTSVEWINSTTDEINLQTSLNSPGCWKVEIITASNAHLITHFYIDEEGNLSHFRERTLNFPGYSRKVF